MSSRSTSSNSSNSSSNSSTPNARESCGNQVEDEEDEHPENKLRYQRSSSLKSGKTPPGTPMKKIVRFADAMGLDLIDIKVFMDEIPRVPKEAYRSASLLWPFSSSLFTHFSNSHD